MKTILRKILGINDDFIKLKELEDKVNDYRSQRDKIQKLNSELILKIQRAEDDAVKASKRHTESYNEIKGLKDKARDHNDADLFLAMEKLKVKILKG